MYFMLTTVFLFKIISSSFRGNIRNINVKRSLKVNIFKNQYVIVILSIIVTLLLVVSFLIISTSYFNTSEINLFTSQCYENGGEVILEIHNDFTSEYSFECK